jgi:hypothetical protein
MLNDPLPSQHYAYPEKFVEIEAVMRLSAVKRWHMIDTFKTQTLAEHSANVAMLAYVIAKKAPGMFFGPASGVAAHALLHDIPEVFIGDIPTHSKRWLDKDQMARAESAVTPHCLMTVPLPAQKLLIKICDLVDGIRFIRIHGVDMTAGHAQEGLEMQLHAKFTEAEQLWPMEVCNHVNENANFYAYETRNQTSMGFIESNGRALENDMA